MYVAVSKIRKIICLSEDRFGHRYSCYIEMLEATFSSLSFLFQRLIRKTFTYFNISKISVFLSTKYETQRSFNETDGV